MEAEDYIETGGKVELFRESLPREKEDAGLINSLVSFIVASSEVSLLHYATLCSATNEVLIDN